MKKIIVLFSIAILFTFSFMTYANQYELTVDPEPDGGGVTVTVTCHDKLTYGIFNNDTARPCDIDTECAKVDCMYYSRPGKCTFSN
ncbi:hypothetical protein [Carboxylicivirga sp. N1Y90]|uniref:hypothetical protein n=1 Tax=Carboxylicivirga fragile TaxID=3417571 RepID=UPI003D344526|nr:hypothetical protein [Marinilabiliaceae bacterium N1Y90]